MAPRKVERFEEVKGQNSIIQYCRSKVNQGNFPDVTLWEGEEGIGKTTLAKLVAMAIHCESMFKPCYECETCKTITQRVIREGKDNEYIKIFNMSIDGGKDAAMEAKEALVTNFSPNGKRVVIFEECHRMSDAAQDVLLTPLENLPKGVYAMFLTTDPLRLSKPLQSRAVHLTLKRPSRREMIELLRMEANRRKLQVNGGDALFEIICTWAEDKPRAALQVLNAMGTSCEVHFEEIREFLNILDVKKVIPLISSLNGSILIGINTITGLPMDRDTHRQLVDILVEAIKLKENGKTYRLSNEDSRLLAEAVSAVDMNRLVVFLYNVAALPELTRQGLIAAYLKDHPYLSNVTTYKPEMIEDELTVKARTKPNFESNPERPIVPTMQELINRGTVIES